MVLRHQLAVLARSGARPVITNDDRSLLGAIAQTLPRYLRTGWLVTPDTLLRWHRRRVASTGANRTGHQDHHPPPKRCASL